MLYVDRYRVKSVKYIKDHYSPKLMKKQPDKHFRNRMYHDAITTA